MKIRKKHEWNGEPRKIDWGQVKSVSYIFPKGSLEDDWREEALRHREEILQLKDQLQQKENIIKEVRECAKRELKIAEENIKNSEQWLDVEEEQDHAKRDIHTGKIVKRYMEMFLEILDKVD